MNKQKQKKSVGLVVLLILLLLVTIASLLLATFAWARYSSLEEGTATAQVAKWDVSSTEGELKFAKEFTHIVSPNKLAPGTNGSFLAALDVGDTEVDVEYKITIVSIENKPTNLIIKNSQGTILAEDSVVATDVIAVTDTTKTVSENITWEWPYQTGTVDSTTGVATGDSVDTTDGENSEAMVIKYKIEAWQVKPE